MAARRRILNQRSSCRARELPLAVLVFFISASLVSAQRLEQWQLWKIDADGSHLALFADTPGYRCGSAQWSPDGKRVAFDTWRLEQPVSKSQIGILNSDGTGWRLIGPGGMPSWSPDGTQLVCHTYFNVTASRPVMQQASQTVYGFVARSVGNQTIDVMNADGTGRETIADHWGSPRWSPHGDRVFSIGQTGDLLVLDLATGHEGRVISGPNSVRQGFCISPDGLRFCFGESTDGVCLATLDERTMRASVRSLVKSGICYHASWAPDGHRVVFSWASNDPKVNDRGQLYVMDVDADSEPTLLVGQDRQRSNVNPSWSPDGKTIIFSSLHTARGEN